MNNEEIFEYMRNNPINLLFKNKENKKQFIDYIITFHRSNINACSEEEYIRNRHITYYWVDSNKNLSKILMYGVIHNTDKEDVYYEDLLSCMTVELL